MEIASRMLGMPSYKRNSSGVSPNKTSLSRSVMRTHAYPRFMDKSRPGATLYDKTFRFANSPMKRNSRVEKRSQNKRRSLEISRCSVLEQREQYRRLIAQYRTTALKEASNLFGKSAKYDEQKENNGNVTVIDLTGRTSPELAKNKAVALREKLNRVDPVVKNLKETEESVSKKPPIASNGCQSVDKKDVSIKDFVSPYLSENFIPNLVKSFGRRERQRQVQVGEEETRARLLREKREAKEALLAEILHEKLKLKEKDVVEVPTLPEITSEMSDIINDALVPYPAQQCLSEAFNISITREHMSTLFGLNWLNDEVINFYMELIVQRSKEKENLPNVHAMNTFFYPKLSRQGYNTVRRWTKKVDIFAKDLVFYPIHLGVHWCLAVIDFTKKEIRYFDSMGGANGECLETLRQYLASEHKNKKGTDYDITGWKLSCMNDIPQQMNGSDCGVFTCKFAEYESLNQDLSFDQKDMPYFRRAMVWEILNKKLLR